MPILEILLAFGLGMFVWYAFEKWQFRRRVRLCSEWMLEEAGDGPSKAKARPPRRTSGRSRAPRWVRFVVTTLPSRLHMPLCLW